MVNQHTCYYISWRFFITSKETIPLLKEEKGLTMLEVVASIAVLAIILLSFSQLFIQNNAVANKNTEKLVVINLADAYLERIKVAHEQPSADPYIVTLNDKEYMMTVDTSKTTLEESAMKLVNVIVTANSPDGQTKGVVEGYVAYN